MFKVKLTKKKNFFPQLKRRLKDLQGEKVNVGWFKEQGYHDRSDYPYESKSPLTYTQLASIMEYGNRYTGMKGFHFRDKMLAMNPPQSNTEVKLLLARPLSGIHKKSPVIKAQVVLEGIGGEYVDNFKSVIGSSTSLRGLKPTTIAVKSDMGTPNPHSPMVAFGSFRAATSYKINGVLVTPR